MSVNGINLNQDEVAIPCGSAARAYFNDTFILQDINTNTIPIQDTGIAWSDDVDFKFKNQDLNKQWIDVEKERFINWMKISPYNNVKKNWGRIETDLPKGDYSVTIENKWDSSKFGGKKYFGLTTTTALGG